MRLIYLLSLLFFGFTATNALAIDANKQTSVFNIQSKIYADGELVSSPKIVTRANQKASVNLSEQNDKRHLKVELLAHDEPMTNNIEPIKINFDILYNNGNETMHSKPKVVVLPSQMAIVKFKSETGHNYELHVIATRA